MTRPLSDAEVKHTPEVEPVDASPAQWWCGGLRITKENGTLRGWWKGQQVVIPDAIADDTEDALPRLHAILGKIIESESAAPPERDESVNAKRNVTADSTSTESAASSEGPLRETVAPRVAPEVMPATVADSIYAPKVGDVVESESDRGREWIVESIDSGGRWPVNMIEIRSRVKGSASASTLRRLRDSTPTDRAVAGVAGIGTTQGGWTDGERPGLGAFYEAFVAAVNVTIGDTPSNLIKAAIADLYDKVRGIRGVTA